jgi:tetratricopeptide (TPR) repeat protein
MDPSRRTVLSTALYSATLAVPRFDQADETLDRLEHQAAGRTVRIGSGDVAVVRSMTTKIADILDELGGAHARPMAAAFLVNSVASYLRADGPEAVRNDMRAAASDLVYLTGWMAMYEKAHGLGQRYYRQALGLAKAAGDQVTHCRTLRGMALQAANLKHANKALELADSAAEAAPSAGPRLAAFLRGQQAHGAALVGDRRLAFTRLRETEAALSQADNRRDAVGGYDQAAYHFHQSAVFYALGDLPGSVRAMQASNKVRPKAERQGNAHANGLLAQRQYEMGHVEAACATWHRFLDDYEALSSARADEHFDIMRRRIRPYVKNNAKARELQERAREVVRQKAVA